MKKRTFLVALGLVGLLVGGGLLASNMGFKLNYPLDGPGVGSSATGTSSLALPFHQQTNLTDSKDLLDDMNAAGPGSVVSVSKFVKSTDGLLTYTGLGADVPFNLVAGEGYVVVVDGTINYTIVGSHNPNLDMTFDGPGVGGSKTGTSFYALPYHTTLADSENLMDELDLAGPGAVVSVSKYVKSTDGLLTYTGLGADIPFALVPGEGYFVVVDGTIVARPSHY